jgi:hypothetical protein
VQANRKNLIGVAVVGALFLVVTVVGLIGNAKTGNYVATPLLLTAIGIAVIFLWLGQFRVRQMLLEKTPDRLIAHYHKTVRRIPHADAAIAYLSALAAAFFGEFDRARKELEPVDWDTTRPMYRGHRLYVLALLAVLEENDYPKALRLTAQAKELEARDAAGGFELLDGAIRLVAGGVPPDELDLVVEKLQKSAKKAAGLVPGIAAWALAVHYNRLNKPDLATEFKENLRSAVPHSVPLKA